jgi:adenylate cyclase
MDYTVVGDAVNVAARLQSLAKSGEILLSSTTHALLGGESVGEVIPSLKLRGRERLIDVVRISTQAVSSSDSA